MSQLGSEFNAFLHAPLGADADDMPLSVLSALARLDVDPWGTAAELAGLPKESAAQRLCSLLARLPGAPLAKPDFGATAEGLVDLLPLAANSKHAPAANAPRALSLPIGPSFMIILYMLSLVVMAYVRAERRPLPPAHAAAASTPIQQRSVPAVQG